MFSSQWLFENIWQVGALIVACFGAFYSIVNGQKNLKKQQTETSETLNDLIENYEEYKSKTSIRNQEMLNQISRDLSEIKRDQGKIREDQRGMDEQNKAHREYTGKSLDRIEKTVASMAK